MDASEKEKLYEYYLQKLPCLRSIVTGDCGVPWRWANDVVTDAMIQAANSDGFKGGNLEAWFNTVVKNFAVSWVRRKANKEPLLPSDEIDTSDDQLGPLDRLINEERYRALADCRKQLSAEEQEVTEEWLRRKSAKKTETETSRFHTISFRARSKLKKCMDGKLGPNGDGVAS